MLDFRMVACLLCVSLLGACGAQGPAPGRNASGTAAEAPAGPAEAGSVNLDGPSANGSGQPLDDPLELGLVGRLALPWTGDLDGMAERGVIRVATTFSRTNFFLDEGRPRGITYELVSAFEKVLRARGGGLADVRVILIPLARNELFDAVISGRADIAAANLSVTSERQQRVAFSHPWTMGIRELVVTGPSGPPLATLDDLAGQRVHVRASSNYFESLQALSTSMRARGLTPPEIIAADELLETEDILELVAAGVYPTTVADSSLTALWREVLPELIVHDELALAEDQNIAWAFRLGSPQLAEAVNAFVQANNQGSLLGNVLIKRYFKDNRWVRNPLHEADTARFDALVALFQTYAQRYRMDWLLTAAQAYQESGLDHNVVSSAGAIGVMQLLPTTAADPNVGIPDIRPIENNVHAGIKYKRFILDRYFEHPEIAPLDRLLFTLAAYNAGPARINQYRQHASDRGLDPNQWFRHVEQVSNLETKTYVSNIFKYYLSYREYLRRVEAIKASMLQQTTDTR